jgi:uncharacterized membrane protein (DUF485 family)
MGSKPPSAENRGRFPRGPLMTTASRVGKAFPAGMGGVPTPSRTNPGPAFPPAPMEHPMESTHAAAPDARLFSALIRKRWTVSLTLTVVMLAVYYGFICILAFRADIFATRIGEHMTLGIPIGLAVIIISWLLTGIYVHWANDDYDAAVKNIKHAMRENQG